ncbi:hypothetical protein EK904_001430 [Melospiza melodia maxima]|nr:hypothetical protein EK904_001430 [Melospiza melodia maxima]
MEMKVGQALFILLDSQNQCLELVIENGLDVNTLLSEHITSNTYDDRRGTALCCAVSNNEILHTKILLKAGANPQKDPLNYVLIAVRADCHGIVKLLLSYGADCIWYSLSGDMMLRLLHSHGYNVEMCLDFVSGVLADQFLNRLTLSHAFMHCTEVEGYWFKAFLSFTIEVVYLLKASAHPCFPSFPPPSSSSKAIQHYEKFAARPFDATFYGLDYMVVGPGNVTGPELVVV